MFSRITKVSYALPDGILTNDELAVLYPGWTADKILEKTGIEQRHISAENETAGDLAEKAARKMFCEHSIDPLSIDFVLLATQSPDYILPTTACILQMKLGISTSSGALDYNLGCSAYIYGLSLAKGLIAGGIAKKVLLLTAETYTKHVHPMDKSARTIFGDGAAATVIAESENDDLGEFVLGTDGRGYGKLIVAAGGMRKARSMETAIEHTDESGNIRAENNLFMDGSEIFSFTLEVVPALVKTTLEKNQLTMEQIDLFVFHQANKFMLDVLRKTIRIPRDKFYMNMADIGNTVSSTIPIALSRAETDGSLKPGMKVMLVGFGVGLSWGATVIRW